MAESMWILLPFLCQILVLFGLLTFLTIFMVIANVIWTKTVGENMWYLAGVGE